jgi:hypothetical protein
MIPGNSSPLMNMINCCIPCFWIRTLIEVQANHFAIVIYSSNEGKVT